MARSWIRSKEEPELEPEARVLQIEIEGLLERLDATLAQLETRVDLLEKLIRSLEQTTARTTLQMGKSASDLYRQSRRQNSTGRR